MIKMAVLLKVFSRLSFFLLLTTIKHMKCEERVQFTANNSSFTLHQLTNNSIFKTDTINSKWSTYFDLIQKAWRKAEHDNTNTHRGCGELFYSVINSDLSIWKERGGIKKEEFIEAQKLGVHYQIVNHSLYRQNQCMFGPRCQGVEHFILNIIHELPNMEMIINVFDYPKAYKHHSPLPVFSFSKTSKYWDIMYPAWTFWSGGPAVSVEPRGLGRWDLKRDSITKTALQWPWDTKKSIVFFRGSRTSSERDSLVLLSRAKPHLVDAAYTKNQAWKSLKDTLNAPPVEEVRLEDHCQYKYLVNFRGVAASFRFKHLFLCRSLVLHSGEEWIEFFYNALIPWVHYIPLPSHKDEIEEVIQFVLQNDDIVQQISNKGFQLIWNHLKQSDVQCYWRRLLLEYHKLTKWTLSFERSDYLKIT